MKTTFWASFFLLFATLPTSAAEWGSLRGRFVVAGSPPPTPQLNLGNDKCCLEAQPVSERVLIGAEGGLANVVVFLRSPAPVHPDLAAIPAKPVVVSNEKCSFRPHIALVRVGQELQLKNVDPTLHNINASLTGGEEFNVVLAAEGQQKMRFKQLQSLPAPIACNVHKFMQGYLVIRDNPYMAVADKQGYFTIANLPAGEWEFQFWHETGYLKNVSVNQGSTDRRGRAKLTVPAGGELELGDITVPAELLE